MEEKKITFVGTNNRYHIKKMTKDHSLVNKRKEISKWNVPESFFSLDQQNNILKTLNTNKDDNNEVDPHEELIKREIEKKLNSYKQQDVLKKRYEQVKFIKYEEVVTILKESLLKCHYCSDKIFIIYETAREMKQWTLDRINNDIGHNEGNVVIACLDCNLKRRCKNMDSYLFTKKLHIVKENNDK
jgi:hypothetical protein